MDVSVLDEKPPGRKPIITAVIPTSRMDEVIAKLRGAIAEGRQAYWVCPLVEESEVLDYASAEERFKRLRAVLGDGVVDLVHGQMHPTEKDAAMARFQSGQSKVLVATTVIEVGVNVPNATIMVIERSEIFGLAQLHQLRGRVGRGDAQSTCLLLYQAPLSESGQKRLSVAQQRRWVSDCPDRFGNARCGRYDRHGPIGIAKVSDCRPRGDDRPDGHGAI
jgi:ATP-dependent DNA helicase RecG